jgi:hypothetical protein
LWRSRSKVNRQAEIPAFLPHPEKQRNRTYISRFAGQATEGFSASDIQEIVGVGIPSYASLSLTYHFGR